MMRKQQKQMVGTLIMWVALLLLVYFLLGSDDVDRRKCPYKVAGNSQANLSIKYFGNPYCIWCIILEPKLKKLEEQKGNSFVISYYDNRYCNEEVKKYGVVAVPFFVFNDSIKEVRHPGYLEDADLRSIICQATGDCA